MTHFIIVYLPYCLSAFTLWMMYLAGNKNPLAWKIGLANQVLWVTWIVVSGTWGLALLTGCLIIMYTRNLLKWRV